MVKAATEEDLAWAAEIVGVPQWKSDAVGIVSFRDGERVAVVVYDTFSPCDCQIHIASVADKKWVTKRLWALTFRLPFISWGLRRITGLVPSRNEPALRFDLKLGFKIEGRMEDGMPNDDLIIVGMTRKNCPYIPSEWRK